MAMILSSGTNSYVSSENFSSHSQTNYYHSHPMPSSGSVSRRSGSSRDSLLTPFDRGSVSPKVEHNPFGIVFNTPAAPRPFIRDQADESFFVSRPILERQSYNQIEEAIMHGKHPAIGFHPKKPANHMVTVVDQSSLNRNGSIVSRSALKHRSSIRSRNLMVRKKEFSLEYDSDDNGKIKTNSAKFKKNKSKFMNFLFPVKRKTSLKYSPLKYTSKPLFSDREQLQQFLGKFTSSDLTKDVIPLQMMIFRYKKLVKVSPELERSRQLFELDEHNNFRHFNVCTKKISDPATERPKITHINTYNNINFNDIVYQKYKSHVFARKATTVPKLEEEFPNDIHQLNKFEIDQINKKLLLEVLIRRTLAAKIGYRLQQSGYAIASTFSSSSSSSTSNTGTTSRFPSSQGENEGTPKESHGTHKKEKDNNKDKSKDQGSDENSSSRVSVDTDVLMRRNASLYSEFLPSPQISYSSNIFGDFKFPSQGEGYEFIQEGEDIPSCRWMLRPLRSSSPIGSPESLYVNDFNKAYRNKYKTQNKVDPIDDSFSSNFRLMPITRSNVTLSSSISGNLVTPTPTFRDKNNSSSSKETSSLAKTDNSQCRKRKYTDSTGHTSFFNNKATSSEDFDKSRQHKSSTNSSLMAPSSVPIVGSSTLATSMAPASILHSPLGQLSSPPSLGYTQISQPYGVTYPQTSFSINIMESLNKNGQVTKQSTTSQIVLETSPFNELSSLKGSISIAGSNTAHSTVSKTSRYTTSTKSDRRSPSKSTYSNDSFHYREKSSLSVRSIGVNKSFEDKSRSKVKKDSKHEEK